MRTKWQIKIFYSVMLVLLPTFIANAEPSLTAAKAFTTYSTAVAARLAQQHHSLNNFIVGASAGSAAVDLRLQRGEIISGKVSEPVALPAGALDGAMLHHWRGTAYVRGAHAADFERLLRDFNHYPQYFAPEVLQARILGSSGDQMEASMRIRQQHVITVVMDTTYNITYGRLDPQHGYSLSQSTLVHEVGNPGTSTEHALDAKEEHGFLWRLNTYWSYEERDGGLYLQIEAVSLTRAVPSGLGWLVGPYIDGIPRESLEFTLRSACNALRK